ncbi:hypothetical protein FO519_004051 [Halicephalobus sp. NKZ332]|nr:hypothetical protein FO519_004051 [Halicephalobus sp. NKZ332]
MSIFRRISLFFSLILYCLVIAFIFTSLATEYWITVRPLEVNGKGPSSAFVHAGLFYGEKRIDSELEYFRETFSVKEEVSQYATSLSKTCWILTIFFISLGVLWALIGLAVSLMNTVIQETHNLLGSNGIFLWSLLSILSNLLGLLSYLVHLHSKKYDSLESLEGLYSRAQ